MTNICHFRYTSGKNLPEKIPPTNSVKNQGEFLAPVISYESIIHGKILSYDTLVTDLNENGSRLSNINATVILPLKRHCKHLCYRGIEPIERACKGPFAVQEGL